MGREADITAIQRAAFIERMLGDARPFGCYDAGCPKCGGPASEFISIYCFGRQALHPDANKMCQVDGEHLHMGCRCKFTWIGKCKDAHDEPGERQG